MKRFASSLVIIAFLAVGCAGLPPYNINPETPNLNIATSDIKPLKVAIVVSDPMPYTLFYNGQGNSTEPNAKRGYSRDCTADCRAGGLMLERDLSKIASDTLSQIFREVVVLRDMPQPGQYDAVVNLNIGQILMQEKVILTGETCNLTAEWNMSVLDINNKEIFNNHGISPVHNFKFSIFTPSKDIILGLNTHLSLILSELAKEWGVTLYNLKIPSARR